MLSCVRLYKVQRVNRLSLFAEMSLQFTDFITKISGSTWSSIISAIFGHSKINLFGYFWKTNQKSTSKLETNAATKKTYLFIFCDVQKQKVPVLSSFKSDFRSLFPSIQIQKVHLYHWYIRINSILQNFASTKII